MYLSGVCSLCSGGGKEGCRDIHSLQHSYSPAISDNDVLKIHKYVLAGGSIDWSVILCKLHGVAGSIPSPGGHTGGNQLMFLSLSVSLSPPPSISLISSLWDQ